MCETDCLTLKGTPALIICDQHTGWSRVRILVRLTFL